EASRRPFTAAEIDPRCGDWGTVQAGHTPGVLVEELLVPSSPVTELLAETGATDWVSPDSIACHLVWSVLYMCSWEIKVRLPTGEKKSEPLGDIFRDGSCLRCKVPLPLQDWPSTVSLLENLLPHTDYVRISFFVKEGWPVLNEVEYTTGGLEVIYVPLAREWNLQWLEGYYRFVT
ncbi:MTR1, partial [Symbiodinium sp. KB8]